MLFVGSASSGAFASSFAGSTAISNGNSGFRAGQSGFLGQAAVHPDQYTAERFNNGLNGFNQYPTHQQVIESAGRHLPKNPSQGEPPNDGRGNKKCNKGCEKDYNDYQEQYDDTEMYEPKDDYDNGGRDYNCDDDKPGNTAVNTGVIKVAPVAGEGPNNPQDGPQKPTLSPSPQGNAVTPAPPGVSQELLPPNKPNEWSDKDRPYSDAPSSPNIGQRSLPGPWNGGQNTPGSCSYRGDSNCNDANSGLPPKQPWDAAAAPQYSPFGFPVVVNVPTGQWAGVPNYNNNMPPIGLPPVYPGFPPQSNNGPPQSPGSWNQPPSNPAASQGNHPSNPPQPNNGQRPPPGSWNQPPSKPAPQGNWPPAPQPQPGAVPSIVGLPPNAGPVCTTYPCPGEQAPPYPNTPGQPASPNNWGQQQPQNNPQAPHGKVPVGDGPYKDYSNNPFLAKLAPANPARPFNSARPDVPLGPNHGNSGPNAYDDNPFLSNPNGNSPMGNPNEPKHPTVPANNPYMPPNNKSPNGGNKSPNNPFLPDKPGPPTYPNQPQPPNWNDNKPQGTGTHTPGIVPLPAYNPQQQQPPPGWGKPNYNPTAPGGGNQNKVPSTDGTIERHPIGNNPPVKPQDGKPSNLPNPNRPGRNNPGSHRYGKDFHLHTIHYIQDHRGQPPQGTGNKIPEKPGAPSSGVAPTSPQLGSGQRPQFPTTARPTPPTRPTSSNNGRPRPTNALPTHRPAAGATTPPPGVMSSTQRPEIPEIPSLVNGSAIYPTGANSFASDRPTNQQPGNNPAGNQPPVGQNPNAPGVTPLPGKRNEPSAGTYPNVDIYSRIGGSQNTPPPNSHKNNNNEWCPCLPPDNGAPAGSQGVNKVVGLTDGAVNKEVPLGNYGGDAPNSGFAAIGSNPQGGFAVSGISGSSGSDPQGSASGFQASLSGPNYGANSQSHIYTHPGSAMSGSFAGAFASASASSSSYSGINS